MARQAGRRRRRHREPGDGDVPVDAAVDLPVARRRGRRPRLRRRRPAQPPVRRGRGPGRSRGPGVRGAARSDPGAERDRLQHLQDGDDRPPAAGKDGRDRAFVDRRLREAARERPGGVRQADQQPPDQGHRVLPRSEGVRPPSRQDAPAPHRGSPQGRPSAARLVGRLLDRRRGVFARDHAGRGHG